MAKKVNKLKKRKIKSKSVVKPTENQIKINSDIDIYGAQFEFRENVEINDKHNELEVHSNDVGKIVLVLTSNLSKTLNEKILFQYKPKGKLKPKLTKVILSDKSGDKVNSIIK